MATNGWTPTRIKLKKDVHVKGRVFWKGEEGIVYTVIRNTAK